MTSFATAISLNRPARFPDRKLIALAQAMASLGDAPGALDVDKLILPGVTQVTD
jgi:hypothetical protein